MKCLFQYNEATDIEPYDDGATVDSLNKEFLDNDKVMLENC